MEELIKMFNQAIFNYRIGVPISIIIDNIKRIWNSGVC